MSKIFSFFLGLLLLGASGAAQAKNMLIIGEDSDPLSLAHDSRPFRSALDVIRGRLASYDIVVYDESNAQVQLRYKRGVPRDEADVLQVAKASRNPPLDKVAILSLYADRSNTSYGSKFDLRMTLKLLAVSTGKVIGASSSRTLEPTPLPDGCEEDCLLEAYSSKVEGLALDLTDQIMRFMPPTPVAADDCPKGPCPSPAEVHQNEFKIILRYPTNELITAFEHWAADMRGSELTPIQTDRAQYNYWFKTDLSPLQLKNELQAVKRQSGQAVDVRMDGETFELRVPN